MPARLNTLIDRHLIDLRTGRNRQFVVADLLERLAGDPIFSSWPKAT